MLIKEFFVTHVKDYYCHINYLALYIKTGAVFLESRDCQINIGRQFNMTMYGKWMVFFALQSMFPDPRELVIDDPSILCDLRDFAEGRTHMLPPHLDLVINLDVEKVQLASILVHGLQLKNKNFFFIICMIFLLFWGKEMRRLLKVSIMFTIFPMSILSTVIFQGINIYFDTFIFFYISKQL